MRERERINWNLNFKKKIMQSEKYIKIGKALINIWLKK